MTSPEMRNLSRTTVKVGIFVAVMLLLTGALFAIFAQYRGAPDNRYSAVFEDASSLKSGDSVRVAGVRVGMGDDVYEGWGGCVCVEGVGWGGGGM